MESLEKIKIKKLKETIIQSYSKKFNIVLTQLKQTYGDISVYKVFTMIKYDGEIPRFLKPNVTSSKEISDRFFSKLERIWPETNLTRKIF